MRGIAHRRVLSHARRRLNQSSVVATLPRETRVCPHKLLSRHVDASPTLSRARAFPSSSDHGNPHHHSHRSDPGCSKYALSLVRSCSCQVMFDLPATYDKALRLIDEAVAAGADLIVFPELYLPGYAWWLWTESFMAYASRIRQYTDNCPEVGGPEFTGLEQVAKDRGVFIVMGAAELQARAGTLPSGSLAPRASLQRGASSSRQLLSGEWRWECVGMLTAAFYTAKATALTSKSTRPNWVASAPSTAGKKSHPWSVSADLWQGAPATTDQACHGNAARGDTRGGLADVPSRRRTFF